LRIKQLKLVGFKSFVEPAELKIESGLTGIVGPNGCGKSNLLEAIRWVMGESSAKSLRGGGMEDVIFAGTASRPARDFAEVTLTAERSAADSATAIIANDDEIEVTRRIERGAGSAYRANGRDVRAKDVALIFADAATGAHSPALVSQNRIGAIISAKPQERRQMLEEAAGISGLHVRRKDAEQKLRAAESNLDRLATILADMDARAGQLRRQAKQAERYRKLTTEIAQAEGRLIFIRWKEAKIAADIAKAEAQAATLAVTEASAIQAALSEQQNLAVKQLADDRATAMAARDAANDLSNKLVQLNSEYDRITQRQDDLTRQSARMADDKAREGKLTHDAAAALDRLQTDSAALTQDVKAAEDRRPNLIRAAENAERDAREGEVKLAKAMAEQARVEAEQRVASAAVASTIARLERAKRDNDRLSVEQSALGDEAALALAQNEAMHAVTDLQAKTAKAAIAIAAADARRIALIEQRDIAQNTLASVRANHAAIISEQQALSRAMAQNTGDKAIDHIAVKPGYERALAAAIGDDANAAIGGDAGRRWLGSGIASASASSIQSAEQLLNFVEAPAQLSARLAMIRVVDTDDGASLNPGERLVTRDGQLRRWDGFVAQDDGATTAERLIRANRLSDLTAALPQAEAEVAQSDAALQTVIGDIGHAKKELAQLNQSQQSADNDLRQKLRDADRAEDMLSRLRAAKVALADRIALARQEFDAASVDVKSAQDAHIALPDGSHHTNLVETLSAQGDAMRQLLMRSQADLSTIDQHIAQNRERRAVAMAEIRSWQERAGEAERRIADVNSRTAEIAGELESLSERPAILTREIAEAEAKRCGVAERLSAMQTAETESEAALKALEAELSIAAEALSSAREKRAGAEARAENQELRRVEMGRVSGERFECPPPILPEKLNFDESDLADTANESARLDRLQADRERIGPVNLIAADELVTLENEQTKGVAESEELTLAINQLRGSIGSLNREGRQRLLAAFEAVDLHFRRLFTTLFNGGQAHLELIDSDDPLQAGLEIMAQPPGKKLSSLSLLSGGEQALTAVALIFALFLTNPAPICVLDEVDAPLDDANIERFCDLLDVMVKETDTRYLIVTHNAVTMARMHRLFGVTMIEQGISRLVSVDLGSAEQLLAAE
jgi:chromosome segregation protein